MDEGQVERGDTHMPCGLGVLGEGMQRRALD